MPGEQSLKLYPSSPELGPLLETHFLSHEAPWVWESTMETAASARSRASPLALPLTGSNLAAWQEGHEPLFCS